MREWFTFRGVDDLARAAPKESISPVVDDEDCQIAAVETALSPCRIVVSIDGTTSRLIGWRSALTLQDELLAALPPHFVIALTAYQNELDFFTSFIADRNKVRALAASVPCTGGRECVADVLTMAARLDVAAVINVTDITGVVDERRAMRAAKKLAARRIPIFMLVDPFDGRSCDFLNTALYDRLARITRGAVLPFDVAGVTELLRLLSTVSQWEEEKMRGWFTFRRVDEALEPKPKSTAIIQLGRAWRAFLWVWRVLRRHPVIYGIVLLAVARALVQTGNPVAFVVSFAPSFAAFVLLSIAWCRFVDRNVFPKHRLFN